MNASELENLWVCQGYNAMRSRGYFYGENPLDYVTPAVLAQLSLSSLLSVLIQCILKPLGESAFISMLLAGFVLGPTLWGNYNSYLSSVYSKKSLQVSETFAFFGSALYVFVIGIKLDMGVIRRARKETVVIGFFNFLLPVTMNLIVAGILARKMDMGPALHDSVYYIAVFQSVTTYHVILCLLADLKLLNSELGQLAISSSMISGTCSWSLVVLVLLINRSTKEHFGSLVLALFCSILLVIFMLYVLRPLMVWMTGKTSEGKVIKEGYIFSLFLMLLGCTFLSEVLGHHALFGAVTLGVVVPNGPPLGSSLVNKIESFVFAVLMPSYFVFSVAGVDILSIRSETVIVIGMLAVCSFIGKVLGAMLPALYFKMPPLEAFSLGLVLSCQGVSNILLLQHGLAVHVLDRQMYSIMILNMLFLSGTFTPIIKLLYNPSRSFEACNKTTIRQTSLNMEFRIMACIYHQDSTPCIIRLLEVSNPTARTPMCCYVVHLVQLTGSLSPLLVYHKPGRKTKFKTKGSSHIINAFRSYEQQSNGNVIVSLFTSRSPFATIHEEICRLAAEKKTSVLIIPFHKQWRLHGIQDMVEARAVNRHILAKAPCSVGILVDRGTLSASKNNSLYSIGVIFVQGRDDREALAYGLRMAKHRKVALTLIHLMDHGSSSKRSLDMELDNDIITEFKTTFARKTHHSCIQEFVKDSVEMIKVIRSVENLFDLILVGRYHDSLSPMFAGLLTEWNEFPELGIMGDMLTSSDSQCQVSVLVVQQQTYKAQDRLSSAKILLEDSADSVEVICELNKGWKKMEKIHKSDVRALSLN